MAKTSRSSATQKNTESYSRERIEKMIRSRSRTPQEQILEAASYAGNRGWFMLTLRLLDDSSTKSPPKTYSFKHRWLLAQAHAAMSDFSGALEALHLEGDTTPPQTLKKRVFELILQLSLSEWTQAIQIGRELMTDVQSISDDFEKARVEILYAVALLHGGADHSSVTLHLNSALTCIQSAKSWSDLQKRSLMRQIEVFQGQERYLSGDYAQAALFFEQGLKNEPKEEDEQGIYPSLFGAWLALSHLRAAQKKGGQDLRPHFQKYDDEIEAFCALDPTPVTAQFEGHFAIALQDIDLARQLWLSSVYPGYRFWLEHHFKDQLFASSESVPVFVIPRGQGRAQSRKLDRKADIKIDAWTGEGRNLIEGTDFRLPIKPGQALQRLLEALALSRYAGLTVFEIHRRIFPDERFNGRTSPAKVRTLVYRLRKELERLKVGLRIEESKDRYQFNADHLTELSIRWMTNREVQDGVRPTFTPGVRSRVEPIREGADPVQQQVYRQMVLLKQHFGEATFSLSQALPVLRLKRSRATQILGVAIQNQWIERILVQREVKYRCTLS